MEMADSLVDRKSTTSPGNTVRCCAFHRRNGRRLAAVGTTCLLLLGFVASARAQQPVPGRRGVAEVRAVVNFQELAAREAASPPGPPKRRVTPFLPVPGDQPVPPEAPGVKEPEPPSAALGLPTALVASPAPLANFAALGDNNTGIPPDTQGAVGPDHLMVTLNTQVRIQSRSGTTLSTVSIDAFWNSTGATDPFDPRVSYDPFSNRWLVVALSNRQSAASSLLIGASQSADPTGNWRLYRLDLDATNTNWGDFPSLGFNKDWAVITINMFSVDGNTFAESNLYAIEKSDLYAGTSISFALFSDSSNTLAPALTYDNTLATLYLVQHWNGDAPGGKGILRISTITGAVGSEVFTPGTDFVSTRNPWASSPPGGGDFAPQKDTADKIQLNDSRISSPVIYRNGSLWAAQTAFLPANSPDRAAVQWWQFLPNGTLQQFGRVDDSTGTFFYAYPSIAVNSQNDVLLGYSSFSASQFASAGYSFRATADAAGTLRDSVLLKAGEATYFKTFSGTDNRWGDFSATVVDPVNDLDFWTIQEYASGPHFSPPDYGRWGTWWGKISINPPRRRGQLISD